MTEIVRLADGTERATGWLPRPAAVQAFLRDLRRRYLPATFEEAAPHLVSLYGADDSPVFFWEAEEKVLQRRLGSWDQGQVGSCVSFGYGRGVQDLLLNEVAAGEPEQWPGFEVATEPIYGGSRVEVGGGGIDGDGSVGAWAAKYVRDYGILLRKLYQFGGRDYDLRTYNESRCRQYGSSGVPDALEPEAKLHPVRAVAQVTTADGLWAAIGARKSVPVCSGQGFTMKRDARGYCQRSGTWNHCMVYRGRFTEPDAGKSLVEQNSWGAYLGTSNDTIRYVKADGSVGTTKLPEGCFAVPLTVAAEALREQDTFALAGLKGWDAPGPTPPPNPPIPPGPMASQRVAGSVWFDFPSTAAGTLGVVRGTCKIVGPVPVSGEADRPEVPEDGPVQPAAAFSWDALMKAIPWPILAKYLWLILPIVFAGIKARKTLTQILAEIWAALQFVTKGDTNAKPLAAPAPARKRKR